MASPVKTASSRRGTATVSVAGSGFRFVHAEIWPESESKMNLAGWLVPGTMKSPVGLKTIPVGPAMSPTSKSFVIGLTPLAPL